MTRQIYYVIVAPDGRIGGCVASHRASADALAYGVGARVLMGFRYNWQLVLMIKGLRWFSHDPDIARMIWRKTYER
jgi:hypothetical protein